MRINIQDEETYYHDAPRGLVTVAGTCYQTTAKQLRAWAKPVLSEVPLERLLQQVDAWLHSARVVTLWALPALLFVVAARWAAAAALALFLAWSVLCPAYVSGPLADAFRRMENIYAQGLLYAVALSVLAVQGLLGAVGVGLASFVVLRWGIVGLLTARPVHWAQAALYPLPPPDQVLRALVVRTALRRRLSLPELDDMKRAVLDAYSGKPANRTSK